MESERQQLLETLVTQVTWQFAHAEVVADRQRQGAQIGEILLPGADDRCVGDLFDYGMRLAADDAIAIAGWLRGRWTD